MTERRGRNRRQLQNDINERQDTVNWKRKHQMPMHGTRFGTGYGPDVRRATE